MRTWVDVSLLALFLAPSIVVRGEEPQAAVCSYGEWSEPEFVARVFLDEPEMAAGVVVGSDVATGDGIPTDRHPFVAHRLSAENIGRPPGTDDLLMPSPTVDVAPDGTLHVIWAEPDKPPDDEMWGRWTHTSLWHASHDGYEWSEPNLLLKRDGIDWGDDDRLLTIDSAGRPHLIVYAGRETLHLMRDADGRWQTSKISDIEFLVYGSVISGGRDSLYFASVDAGGTGNPNSIFLRTSADGGRTWSNGRPVYLSAGRQAGSVQLLRSPVGELHLVWEDKNPANGFDAAGFRHIASSDDGRTWSEIDEVGIPEWAMMSSATIDRCGAIHLAYQVVVPTDDRKLDGRLHYTRWDNGWSEPVALFPKLPMVTLTIGLDEGGGPALYWLGARGTDPATAEVGGFVSRLAVGR